MSKFLRTLVFTAALTALLAVSALAASTGAGMVNAGSVNLRAESGTASAVKTVVYGGSLVVVSDGSAQDGWYKVVYDGRVGYMSAEYVSFSQNLDGDFGYGVINGSEVRMRAMPDFNADILGTYGTGVKVSVAGVYGQWYKVSYNGQTGYIHSDYISLKGSDSSSAAATPGQTIVDTAMKYLGTPYVWGGTSTSGFDCSGFVYYVFKECGYSTNRTAASIYENGVYVEKSDLQPGDAICFTTRSSSGIGHVGIYIGDGQFIHSSSSDTGVIISDLGSNYYTNNYVGARRIV